MSKQAKLPNYATLLISGLCGIWFKGATAFSWPLEQMFQKVKQVTEQNSIELQIHPFLRPDSLSLTDMSGLIIERAERGELSLESALATIVSDHIPYDHTDLQVKITKITPNELSLSNDTGKEILSAGLEVNEIPFCEYEVKAIKDMSGSVSMLGRLPNLPSYPDYTKPEDWPNIVDSWERGKEQLSMMSFLDEEVPKLVSYEKCYDLINDQVTSLWKMVGRVAGRSYTILADTHGAYQISPLYFEVDGNIQAYRLNPKDGELVTYTTKLTGEGYLRSTFFETNTDSNDATAEQEAFSLTHNFVYSPNEPEFPEASVFIHATNMLAFFQGIGYRFTETQPILLEVHAILGNNQNNALYQPPGAVYADQAVISIGDGDGTILQNLALDSDVVSHEFGHHVVFETLKTTSGESLVLHEGLADFFAFSRTKDACLGESICPDGSTSCMIEATCLRTADLDLRYGDTQYQTLGAHLKGQVVSGLLWDLREPMGLEGITKVTFTALNYFVRDTGFQDFLAALLLADQELNQGANACTIYDAAVSKGLSFFLQGVDCNNSNTWFAPGDGPRSENITLDAPRNNSSSDNGFFSCGSIGLSQSAPLNSLSLLLLFTFPLFAVFLIRRFSKPL
ncbi:MAG: hypothetical protein HRU09_14845 [Oligoflexales bacterium]|nr:hypothetical protein [Oligoflexales bacterium]